MALALGVLSLVSSVEAQQIKTVSSGIGVTRPSFGNSSMPGFSRDGRFLLFISDANDLAINDGGRAFLDVFRHDFLTGDTVLISCATNSIGGGSGNSLFPSASSNAQFIAFESSADNLVPGDTNGRTDIFVRDVDNQITTLVSVSQSGSPGDGASQSASISGDGRWVAFESLASDVVTNDVNNDSDIFVRDVLGQQTILVSVDQSGYSSASGRSFEPKISVDRHWVWFQSTATNIVEGVTNKGELYVRDLNAGKTYWASRDVSGLLPTNTISYRLTNCVYAASGSASCFGVAARSLAAGERIFCFHFDPFQQRLSPVPGNPFASANPILTDDGQRLVYGAPRGIYIWDALGQTNSLAWSVGGFCSEGTFGAPPGSAILLSISSQADVFAYRWIDCLFDSATVIARIDSQNACVIGGTNSNRIILPTSLPVLDPQGTKFVFESDARTVLGPVPGRSTELFVKDLSSGQIDVVSATRATERVVTGSATSGLERGAISANGQFVLFSSFDGHYADFDTNDCPDLFLQDLASGAISPISIAPTNYFPFFGPFMTNRIAYAGCMSADARYIAFASKDKWQFNNGSGLFSPSYDVYVHDRARRQTWVVDTNYSGGASYSSLHPTISSDGRWLAFDSTSQLLLNQQEPRPNNFSAVYVRLVGTNRFHGRTSIPPLVSIERTGISNGNGDSILPLASPDSRWVVFLSAATDLTLDHLTISNRFRLYGRDLISGQTGLLSYDHQGSPINANITNVFFSADSRFVFFEVPDEMKIYRCELLSASTVNFMACSGCGDGSASEDGRFIAYTLKAGDTNLNDILLKDLATGEVKLATPATTGIGGASARCVDGQISPDARYLVFSSVASNLVPEDSNGAPDVFARDLRLGTTSLLSVNLQRTRPGNAASYRPVLAPDGRTVAFQSYASDLVSGDQNDTRDVFVARLPGTDSDRDGLDDEWELAYFNTLARDGTGDFDEDGRTDLEEFLAGTDPTDRGSVLQVTRIAKIGVTGTTLVWRSAAGRSYSVQYKDAIEGAWTTFGTPVKAQGPMSSYVDGATSLAAQRFYRIVLLR